MFCLIKMNRRNADTSARRVHHYLHGVNTDASLQEGSRLFNGDWWKTLRNMKGWYSIIRNDWTAIWYTDGGGELGEVVFYLMTVIGVRYEGSCECGSYSMYRNLVASKKTVNISIWLHKVNLRLVTACIIYCIIIIGGLEFEVSVKEKYCCRIMAACLGQETGSFVVMTW